jgi:hypothetical protein
LKPVKIDKRTFERSKRFYHTEPSKYEIRYNRIKNISNFLLFLYLVLVSLLVWQLHKGEDSILPVFEYSKYVSYALLTIGLNLLIIFPLVFIALKTTVFPYNFWIVRDIIIGSNSISYSQDFATLIERSYILMCTNALQQTGGDYEEFIESDYLKSKKE